VAARRGTIASREVPGLLLGLAATAALLALGGWRERRRPAP
jgi:hypothetical protein